VQRTKKAAGYLYRHHFIRYLFVGGTTFILDEGLLILLHGHLDVWLPLALFIAYLVAFIYNFSLNRWWTFSASENKTLKQHMVPYTLLFFFNLAFTVVFVSLASHVINYALAKAIAVVIQVGWNFIIYKYVIFTKTAPTDTSEDTKATTSKA
jgi:putative flippase GtrA